MNRLRIRFGLESIRVVTFQAVSGAGREAVHELRDQARAVLEDRPVMPNVFPDPCAFNVFCHESALDLETGLCDEEAKMIQETAKIWADDPVRIAPFCMRVPVFRAHTQVVTVQLRSAVDLEAIRETLESTPGLELVDDREQGRFPTPVAASGGDSILAGRLRPAASTTAEVRRHREWSMVLCCDQLRKGAALNALQILDRLGWRSREPERIDEARLDGEAVVPRCSL
jgi:aspartate-semialdehyde dehydrogenase